MNNEIVTPQVLAHYGLKGVHEAASIMPPMTPDEFQGLHDSIAERGLLNPIKATPDGLLLEGRHRLVIAHDLNIAPTIETVTVKDPLLWVIDQNVHRRHLTVGQRASIASSLANGKHGSNQFDKKSTSIDDQKSTKESSIDDSFTLKQAAKRIGVSAEAITRYRTVEQYAPETALKVAAGEVTLNAACDIARENKWKVLEAEAKVAAAQRTPYVKTMMGIPVIPDPVHPHKEVPNAIDFMRNLASEIEFLLHPGTPRRDKLDSLIKDRALIREGYSLRKLITALQTVASQATEIAAKLEAKPQSQQKNSLPVHELTYNK